MTIEKLSSEIINQIAAGEVIENPSAVIKELVENSIDAKATQIDVEIEDAGIKRITIKDNGVGINKSDLANAPLRHATSKIKSFDDLYNINTMGFRGEALASIFSVSKAKIISKVNNEEANEITSESMQVREGARGDGTTIHIEELFYNTPARRKYLKSENLELKSIVEIMNRFEIFYHNIKLTLTHNGKILINKPAFESSQENLYYILGRELKGDLFEVDSKNKGLNISGFIGKPSSISYPYRKNQYLFVNGRYIKSKIVRDAIYEGFGTNLMEGRHPLFVVNLEIDPEVIDVNVHPTKIEIKFENEMEVYEIVKNSIIKVFEKNESFKEFETKKVIEEDETLDMHVDEISPSSKPNISTPEKSYFNKETQHALRLRDSDSDYEIGNRDVERSDELPFSQPATDTHSPKYGPLYDILKDYRVVGQVNKTFVLLETPTEMIVVDQHVAEEKFYFETFKEELENKKVSSQVLLKSQIVKLDSKEFLEYKENEELLERLGFEIEEFGENELIVRAVPIGIKNKVLDANIVKDILNEITVDKKFKMLEEDKIEKLASMSCKRSIKAGYEMTSPEIHSMIENLKKLKEPFNCPHGRPILLRYTFTDLEKKFKRIV